MKLLVFGAKWCGPTIMLRNALRRAKIDYEYININGAPNRASELDIKGVPTTLVLDQEDIETARYVGFSSDLCSTLKRKLDDE